MANTSVTVLQPHKVATIVESAEMAADKVYPIRPAHIQLWSGEITEGRFGIHEIETSAGRLVSFFQARGYWSAFSIEEVRDYYMERGWDPNLMFYGLLGSYMHARTVGWDMWMQFLPLLVVWESGMYCVTDIFVDRCAGTFSSDQRALWRPPAADYAFK